MIPMRGARRDKQIAEGQSHKNAPDLREKTHDNHPRCQAIISYGPAWVAGRKQCLNAARKGEAFCGTHLSRFQRHGDLLTPTTPRGTRS